VIKELSVITYSYKPLINVIMVM